MYFHDGVDYPTRASMLIRQFIDEHDPRYGTGSMTCSIYDTAWVSMIAKTANGQKHWLFPSSFQYLLDHQQHDGGWKTNSSDIDGILNSLAALLAFCRHLANPYQLEEGLVNLRRKKSHAIYFLETNFSYWDVESAATHPGFQPLVAKLLYLLQQEGIQFSFPGKELFLQMKENKKQEHSQAALYGSVRTAATYSLEGRVGEIDFDRIGQHKICGSMMASPASTAAYLMNCSTWDDEAEAYLSHIVSVGDRKSTGGVPTKFPTTVFEVTGLIATLLENGFSQKDLGTRTLESTAGFLQDCLQLESGVTGFAPYVESDADNTAKAISALCLLGKAASPRGLIICYETREYFKTYMQDRSPSFRTNCHVLKALLDLLPNNSEQMPQIEKVLKFLCNCWWTTNGQIEDQMNTSSNYPIMLMAEVFMRLIDLWERGFVPVPEDPVTQDKVIISLFQVLTRTLQTQNPDGSWGSGSCESTSYAVITLTKLMTLSSAPSVKLQVTQAIENGRKFLLKNFRPFSEPDHVWTGKITSGSSVLYQAFVLAALQAPVSKPPFGPTIESRFEIPLAKVTIQTRYYAQQSWLANTPEWLIQACLIESHLFLPQIRDVRYAVFPSDSLKDDRYFESIPFTWIVASNLDNRYIGAEFLHQMMILTVLGRQSEDYMENVVGEIFAGCLFEVEEIIYDIFQELEIEEKDQCFCDGHGNDTLRSSTATAISDVRSVIYRFISHVLNHPYVLMASSQDQIQLRSELLSFLLSRVNQLSGEQGAKTATDQTSHPYMFAFLACLVGNQSSIGGVGLRRDFLDTPEQQYLAADLCRHMSIISFMSGNADEQPAPPTQPAVVKSRRVSFGNHDGRHAFSSSMSSASTASSSYDDSVSLVSPISSVSSAPSGSSIGSSFPKPPSHQPVRILTQPSEESLQMSRLVAHEHRCLTLCMEGLQEAGISQRTTNVLKLFIDAKELSDHIYRDPNIGSTCQPTHAPLSTDQACILNPPPVPPKSNRRSVSAAGAALTVGPLATKQSSQQVSRVQSFAQSDDCTLTSGQDQGVTSSVAMERDWSWNKKPIILKRRKSRAPSEISRIESIMSEIDGIKLQTSKPEPRTQRRITSESDASWIQPKPKIDAQRCLTDKLVIDAEAMKLAKARLETQRRVGYEVQKHIANDLSDKATAEIAVQKRLANERQSKSTENLRKQEVKMRATCTPESAGWVKSPPPAVKMPTYEMQASKLHRASKLGGPKWKAPF